MCGTSTRKTYYRSLDICKWRYIDSPVKQRARLAAHTVAYETTGVRRRGRLLPRKYADLMAKFQLDENHCLPSACQLNWYQPFQRTANLKRINHFPCVKPEPASCFLFVTQAKGLHEWHSQKLKPGVYKWWETKQHDARFLRSTARLKAYRLLPVFILKKSTVDSFRAPGISTKFLVEPDTK